VFKSIRVGSPRSPVTVVCVCAEERAPAAARLAAPLQRRVADAMRSPGFRAEAGETLVAGTDLVLLGMGARGDVKAAVVRKAGGALVRRLDRMEARGAMLAGLDAAAADAIDGRSAGRAFAEGMGLANWRVDHFDGTATKNPPPLAALTVTSAAAAVRTGLADGLARASCVNEARRLAVTPPNIGNPAWMAREARALARRAGLACRVMRFDEIKRQGMGGLASVGQGSASKPCLIMLEHRPARAKRGVRIVLVGKTMTYDTGGYAVKPLANMKGMKYDGNGGCAVLGAMLAIAQAKLPVSVVALLPTAENMIAGDAYRPDDIITMYNGVTVEVTNTDAEGRLVVADAMAYACRRLQPTVIVDVATLTGGVVVALGSWCAGFFCNDDDLRRRLESAADDTDERVWRLPLWPEHREFMRARHADLWNSGPKRDGHPIQGAAFLSFFVDEKIPWAHIDIAGVSAVEADRDVFVTGPTGYGVRLLTELVRSYASGSGSA
jgi:leucyl aminopeptidase